MNEPGQVRQAVFADRRVLSELMAGDYRVHRHLDWRDPLDWIGERPFLVLEKGGELEAVLACPPEPPGVAWLRLFCVFQLAERDEVWLALWKAARVELVPGTIVAAIVMAGWMAPCLVESGFTSNQGLVMLERNASGFTPKTPGLKSATIRPLLTPDLPQVAEVDALAFAPLWQNTVSDLSRAHARASIETVAEQEGRIVGYQISTRTSLGMHLARLAVHPACQGRGIGSALVEDLFQRAGRLGIRRFTVNTQSDNSTSLSLYRTLGFEETGETYPVYHYNL